MVLSVCGQSFKICARKCQCSLWLFLRPVVTCSWTNPIFRKVLSGFVKHDSQLKNNNFASSSKSLVTGATGNGHSDWSGSLTLTEADYDWSFHLHPGNTEAIKNNIINRKSTGDITNVIRLQEKFLAEEDLKKKQIFKQELLKATSELPNMSHPDSPIGDESCARMVRTFGSKRHFPFPPKSAVDIGERLGLLRTKNVVLTTGEKTYYFIDDLPLLEQALIKFSLQRLLRKGFTLVSVPDLIDPSVIQGAGFPTSGERTQVYSLDPDLHGKACLSGTAEMPLAGCFAGEVLNAADVPRKMCAVSRCYRAETSTKAEEAGIYRVHQFTKVEMFALCCDDGKGQSSAVLQEFVDLQQQLFSELDLHCRILDMPSEELGAPAHRKYDIEAWMPNKEMWGEISSASNCTDFQSRRLGIKYRAKTGDLKYVHTVNGTACAVPRLIMALLENGQNPEGTVGLPEALWPYMEGVTTLTDKRKGKPSPVWQKKLRKK